MDSVVVAVLVPPILQKRSSPSHFPIAKAINSLAEENIITVFGFQLESKNNTVWIKGSSVKESMFTDVYLPVHIIHDRFPSQIRSDHYLKIKDASGTVPFGNPHSLTLLCRDKLKCQHLLEEQGINMPDVVDQFDSFADTLKNWGNGFLKPRFGALGINVQAVTTTDALPRTVQGVVPGQQEPTILQRAISPPSGWAGLSVRQLVQRTGKDSWVLRTAVLRRSKDDAVVNVAKGAEAVPAVDFLPAHTIEDIQRQSDRVCKILSHQADGLYAVEFGLDFVIDSAYQPWLIEVNSRPRGRLEALAVYDPDRFALEHQAACVQPIRYLASLCKPSSEST